MRARISSTGIRPDVRRLPPSESSLHPRDDSRFVPTKPLLVGCLSPYARRDGTSLVCAPRVRCEQRGPTRSRESATRRKPRWRMRRRWGGHPRSCTEGSSFQLLLRRIRRPRHTSRRAPDVRATFRLAQDRRRRKTWGGLRRGVSGWRDRLARPLHRRDGAGTPALVD